LLFSTPLNGGNRAFRKKNLKTGLKKNVQKLQKWPVLNVPASILLMNPISPMAAGLWGSNHLSFQAESHSDVLVWIASCFLQKRNNCELKIMVSSDFEKGM